MDDPHLSQKVVPAGSDAPQTSVTAPSAESSSAERPEREISVGTVLAERYQIEATLGQGGSGTVHRAWDRVLGEPIAMKILRADRARERSWIMRLAREVKVARAIRHPNVCRVFELGQADGHWFVTMELGTDQTLRTLFNSAGGSSARPLAERLADARAICAGLAAMHAVGIVHRDVTPQNVLRMEDGRLVISDFGLAIELTATTTMHGGTPNYMPPETLLGQRADHRSDVWQLGLLLHELFFGTRPIFSEAAGKTTMQWPLPSGASPVEEELARLCGACLSVAPAARPATALAVAGQLAAAEQARPRSPVQRAWLRARDVARRQRGWISAALIVAACGGIARAVRIADRPRLCRAAGDRLAGLWDSAVKDDVRLAFDRSGRSYAAQTFATVDHLLGEYLGRWSQMYTEACEATNVRGEQSGEVLDLRMACLAERLTGVKALTQILVHADGPVVDHAIGAAGALRTLDRCADAQLLRNVLALPDDPSVRSQVASLRGGIAEARAFNDAGNEREARDRLRALVADARRVGYGPALAEALLLLGEIEGAAGDLRGSEQALKEAAWIAEASRDDALKAEAATFLVATLGHCQRFAEADDWAREADAVLRRIGGEDRLRAWLENHVSANLDLSGRREEALAENARSIALKQEAGAGRSDLGRSLNNRALILDGMGRYAEALPDFDRAIEDMASELGREHPLVAITISNKGETLDHLGRHEDARVAFEQALALEDRGFGPESRPVAYPLTGLGLSFLADHRPLDARAPLERAARIRQAKEPNRELVAETEFALARALRDAGVEPARAQELAASAEETYARVPAQAKKAREISTWLATAGPVPSARR